MGVCFRKWETEIDSRWRLSTTVVLEQWSQTVRSGRQNGNCKDSRKEVSSCRDTLVRLQVLDLKIDYSFR